MTTDSSRHTRIDSSGESPPKTCCKPNEYPEHFNFPFQPYDIQLQLMKVAYESFTDNKFALLESPTGTGKSLSLICSSLTWLKEHQSKTKQKLEDQKQFLLQQIEDLKLEEDKTGDWLISQSKQRDINRSLDEVVSELNKILKFEQKSEARRHAKLHDAPLEHYSALKKPESRESIQPEHVEPHDKSILGHGESQELLGEDEDIDKKVQGEEEEILRPKVYFASRTHSQLSQFVNEVKRTTFASPSKGAAIKVVPLASRANLCVNMDVLKLKDPSAINERCMEMQKETNKEKRCPYAKLSQITLLKEDILSSVKDIEDIASRGRGLGSCAYYASRMAIPEAELVVLPYNNLLHHETRKATSLDLKDSIVILDEAHNILETICSIHSASITGQNLIASHTILSRYYQRYHNRMTPKNALIIYNIVKCITALIKFLDNPKQHIIDFDNPNAIRAEEKTPTKKLPDENNDSKVNDSYTKKIRKNDEFMIEINKFLGAAKIEQFNIYKLIDYFNRSQLAKKLLGFIRHDNTLDLTLEIHGLNRTNSTNEQKPSDTSGKKKLKTLARNQETHEKKKVVDASESTSLEFLKQNNLSLRKPGALMVHYPVYTLVEFLKALTNFTNDGKVLVSYCAQEIQQSILKFVLLNPSSQFKQMTEDARSIVLAGGTMQPFSEFSDLLFRPLGIEKDRLRFFSCGHVVRSDQIFVSTLSSGPTGKPLELSYKTRSSFEMIDEIGRTLLNIAISVPGGMVCFMPSYEYEQFCFNRWTQVGILGNIEAKCKQIFREPRQASHLKPILDEYSRTIEKNRHKGRGALLFCVVGGKMSEGINFNDDLGRCVVVVGLPYANVKSSELQQKMAHYDKTCKMSSGEANQLSPGQQYYENLCVKGINQSIGRAIRHREDYAAIILLDRRYSFKTSIKTGLPAWLRQSLVAHERFGPMISTLKQFFKAK